MGVGPVTGAPLPKCKLGSTPRDGQVKALTRSRWRPWTRVGVDVDGTYAPLQNSGQQFVWRVALGRVFAHSLMILH
jgi:hypothetical protein